MTDELLSLSQQYLAKFGKDADALYRVRTLGYEQALAAIEQAIRSGNPLPPPDYSNGNLI